MKRIALLVLLAACGPTERYGFVTTLGRDTIAVESVTRHGNTVTSDAVDRFPRVRRRHTEIALNDDGSMKHLVMDVHTPSEPAAERERHVVAEVTRDSVHLVKADRAGTLRREWATQGGEAMPHVPQSYALYELYLAAALRRAAASHRAAGDTIQMRQFYLDREFDRFPLHHGLVRRLPNGTVEIAHDWLSGTGEATVDSSYRLTRYSGARTTYDVVVTRVDSAPDVTRAAAAFEAEEAKQGGVRQLSVRDTTRATIGTASFVVDYGRPLARGRTLLGAVIPYDRVWRTGANAATQFETTAPITLGTLAVPAGKYTLWTVPHADGRAELIVNRQTGQWGTGYGSAHDLGRVPLTASANATPVERFTIAIDSTDARRGTLALSWGTFRWTAPIQVSPSSVARR